MCRDARLGQHVQPLLSRGETLVELVDLQERREVFVLVGDWQLQSLPALRGSLFREASSLHSTHLINTTA